MSISLTRHWVLPCILLYLLATSQPAWAEPFHWTVAPGFALVPSPSLLSLGHYKHKTSSIEGSLIRFPSANRAAFQRKRSDAFIARIRSGLSAQSKVIHTKQQRKNGTLVLDIVLLRTHQKRQEKVWMRFLFRWKFTVVAIASLAQHAPKAAQRSGRKFTENLRP